MAVTVINGPIIAAGEWLSSAVDCSAGRIMRITTPAEWTGANISFQISTDGNGFEDLYLSNGSEVVIPCGPSRAIAIDDMGWPQAVHLKIRSGTAQHPIQQESSREFSIALNSLAPG